MPDRVREAIFNILGHHYQTPGELPPLFVADVFAGSGSIGLEALSRGATQCVFFERDSAALLELRANVQALAATESSTIVTTDAWRSAAEFSGPRPFDLVFLDPPYRDSQDPSSTGLVQVFLRHVYNPTNDPSLVVLHHPPTARYEPARDCRWRVLIERRIGSNGITIFTR